MPWRMWRRYAWRTGLALVVTGLTAAAAQAQSSARWDALYERIIRLEHEIRALRRGYDERLRRLEAALAQVQAGKRRPPHRRRKGEAAPGRPGATFAPLPALPEPDIREGRKAGGGQSPEQVLGHIGEAAPPPATPSAPAAMRAASASPSAPPAAPGASGPIPLPGAVSGAVGAPPAGDGAAALAPEEVAAAPLPPPNGDVPAGTGVPPAANPPASASPALPPRYAGLSADALLKKARASFLTRRYDEAEAAYRAFLARFADHPKAADARFELGETLYIQGRFREAGKLFVDVYRAAPGEALASRALLRLGQALKRMGRKKEACKAWGSLRQRYPDTRAARLQAPREMKRLKCRIARK